jgi:hypothetical protein
MNPPKLPHSIYSRTECPTRDDVEFEMLVGQLVFILQDTEQAIRFCDLIVFNPQEAQVTTDVFRSDKRWLGRLVKNIQKKTSLDDGFQRTLEAFVENRNILSHRALDQPRWKAKNQGQFAGAFAFLQQLLDQTETVKLAFEAVVLDYMQKNFTDESAEVLEPFRRSGYLDAIKAFSEFSKAAIKRTD